MEKVKLSYDLDNEADVTLSDVEGIKLSFVGFALAIASDVKLAP